MVRVPKIGPFEGGSIKSSSQHQKQLSIRRTPFLPEVRSESTNPGANEPDERIDCCGLPVFHVPSNRLDAPFLFMPTNIKPGFGRPTSAPRFSAL